MSDRQGVEIDYCPVPMIREIIKTAKRKSGKIFWVSCLIFDFNSYILSAIKTVKSCGFNVEITGLWVDENWKVCEA